MFALDYLVASMNCPKCQTQNSPESKFCKSCGANLTSPLQPSTVSTSQVPASQPTPTPSPVSSEKAWWEKWWGILLLVILTGPLGMIIIYMILKNSNLSQTKKTALVFLIGLFFFSVSVYFSSILIRQRGIFLSSEKTTALPASSPVKEESTSLPVKEESTPVPTQAPILKTVGTEFQGVEVSLTKIERGINMVTAYFTFTATGDTEYSSIGTPLIDPSIDTSGFKSAIIYDLSLAYLIDDASQMKYEVMKDASGKSLATLLEGKYLEKGTSISLYAQFTAPPETTTIVTIILPMVQPFTNISLD